MSFVDKVKEIEPKVLEICDEALKIAGIKSSPHVNQIFACFQALVQVVEPQPEVQVDPK